MHSFAMSERHVVLAEFPLVVNPIEIPLRGRPFIENYRWQPERGTRLQVIDRADGTLRGTWETEACFAFHHIAAFERDGELVLDVAAYEDATIIESLYLDRLRATAGGALPPVHAVRWRLPLGGGEVRVERLAEESFELPRINGRLNGLPYRFAYGIGARAGDADTLFAGLVKLDVESGATASWRAEGCHPGEPVFVARPGAGEEDDGVVLSVVLDAPAGRSFLLVLDARSFEELARAEAPQVVPFGFHGHFARSEA